MSLTLRILSKLLIINFKKVNMYPGITNHVALQAVRPEVTGIWRNPLVLQLQSEVCT